MQDRVTLEEQFEKKQQEQFDAFKVKMQKIADETLGNLYTDVVNHACTDAHTNYHNFLRDEFRESFIKEIVGKYTHYSWAHSIRMEMLKRYPTELRNKIIDDLQDKIKSLEEHNLQLREHRSRY